MRSIELFAGAGGLGMGVAAAGFDPVNVVEWDADCCRTLRLNSQRGFPLVENWPLTQGDVRNVSFAQFEGKVDLITRGPPCQPFSLAGKHLAYDDHRDMFPQAVRAAREVKPKAFIFENVKGLTRDAFRNYVEYIRLQMVHPELVARRSETWQSHFGRLEKQETSGGSQGLRYKVLIHLANAADYGIPQKRERVFFIGFRDDLEIRWSFPNPTHSSEALAWSQYRDGLYWDQHKVAWKRRPVNERTRAKAWKTDASPATLPWRTVRDAFVGLPDPMSEPKVSRTFANHVVQPGARSYPGHTGSPIDEPAKTLKAGVHGVPGGENMLLLPDGALRYFTVRESARLQTFPDAFEISGSWTEAMRQLGNAVPVELARIVASDIHKHLQTNFAKTL